MARKPKYGDVYQMPNGALWMVIAPDGERRTFYTHSRPEEKQWYHQLPLTDDPDEEIKACWQLGEYVRE